MICTYSFFFGWGLGWGEESGGGEGYQGVVFGEVG